MSRVHLDWLSDTGSELRGLLFGHFHRCEQSIVTTCLLSGGASSSWQVGSPQDVEDAMGMRIS